MAQFILSDDGTPLFAVITYKEFQSVAHILNEKKQEDLVTELLPVKKEPVLANANDLLSKDGRFISLPHGGGYQLNIAQLVDYFLSNSISVMAINQRAQKYEIYPPIQRNTLDPLIRWNCLRQTPYFNTMQSVQLFIDALVSTGLFIRTTHYYPNVFTRAVNSISIVRDEALAYLKKYPISEKWTIPK